ncbi:MAG: ArsR/SmtB family transcription factor [Blastocatellales bacterium]
MDVKGDVENELVEIAALIGEPARTMMLWNLSGGEARPAGELAFYANISAQNASAHLAKLVEAGLLTVEAQGRHRYYRITSPEVAHAIEALAALTPTSNEISASNGAANKAAPLPRGQTPDLKYARTCYDHLAGRIAVEICAALKNKRFLAAASNGGDGFEVTPEGEMWFRGLGIETDSLRRQRRAFARRCLDWSERQPHLAGALGAALLEQMFRQDWIARVRSSRVIRVTAKGRADLDKLIGLAL